LGDVAGSGRLGSSEKPVLEAFARHVILSILTAWVSPANRCSAFGVLQHVVKWGTPVSTPCGMAWDGRRMLVGGSKIAHEPLHNPSSAVVDE
jgi:hypothetical protein